MLDLLEKNKEITYFSSFRTKAFAKYFFEIQTYDDIEKLDDILVFCKNKWIKYQFIWWGTNLLFAFDEYDWLIIRNRLVSSELNIFDNKVEVFSWDNVISVTNQLIKLWYDNFKAFLWLPWTFWWALVWNAWCFWIEIKDVFISAKIYNIDKWEIFEINKDFLKFDYRNSLLKNTDNKFYIISMVLDLDWYKWDDDDKVVNSLEQRKKTQPRWATCGSFFKNPEWDFAWRLIEEAWLKWKHIWWAVISDMHANFFINLKDASYHDILNLRDLAKNKVKEKFWVELIEEVKIIEN